MQAASHAHSLQEGALLCCALLRGDGAPGNALAPHALMRGMRVSTAALDGGHNCGPHSYLLRLLTRVFIMPPLVVWPLGTASA